AANGTNGGDLSAERIGIPGQSVGRIWIQGSQAIAELPANAVEEAARVNAVYRKSERQDGAIGIGAPRQNRPGTATKRGDVSARLTADVSEVPTHKQGVVLENKR